MLCMNVDFYYFPLFKNCYGVNFFQKLIIVLGEKAHQTSPFPHVNCQGGARSFFPSGLQGDLKGLSFTKILCFYKQLVSIIYLLNNYFG